jgi:hypothetical protein
MESSGAKINAVNVIGEHKDLFHCKNNSKINSVN